MDINQINEGLRLEEGATKNLLSNIQVTFTRRQGNNVSVRQEWKDDEYLNWLWDHARELLECARRCGEMESKIKTLEGEIEFLTKEN